MKAPEIPVNENARIKALQSLSVLDTPPEERIDRITKMARKIFDVPVVLVSLIDVNRQWFKSCAGTTLSETSRKISFCAHAILQDDVFVVRDTHNDSRFADNPLVTNTPGYRFYAGYPLTHPEGLKLGTLCLIDFKPRDLDAEQIRTLKELATLVELELMQTQSVTIDPETGLSNKEGFLSLAKYSLGVCKRLDLKISVAFLYVSGYLCAETEPNEYRAIIRTVGNVFKRQFRSSDIVGRYNQQGFVALFTNVDQETTDQSILKLTAEMNDRFFSIVPDYDVKLMTGTVTGSPNDDLEDLIFNAFKGLQE